MEEEENIPSWKQQDFPLLKLIGRHLRVFIMHVDETPCSKRNPSLGITFRNAEKIVSYIRNEEGRRQQYALHVYRIPLF